jgi:predicted  nucleic acid-binding Zn-ribbon protein
MNAHQRPRRIQPKISTMPRQQSEAAHYLDIYKLTVEKKRLRQELAAIEHRRQRIQERLTTLEAEVEILEDNAQFLRQPVAPSQPHSRVYRPAGRPAHIRPVQAPETASAFEILTLDY